VFSCKVAFSDVAGVAEGLEVGEGAGAAFAVGEDVIDMEGGTGGVGRAGSAVDAAEIVALHNEMAQSPGDGARCGRGFGFLWGWCGRSGFGIRHVPGCLPQGFAPLAKNAYIGFAPVVGVRGDEVGQGGLAGEFFPELGEVGQELGRGDVVMRAGCSPAWVRELFQLPKRRR